MIPILLNLMGKIFLMVVLGYFLRRKNIITAQFQADLTSFMMKVALPANVLTTASNTFSPELSRNLLITAAVAAVYYVVALLLTRILSRFLPLNDQGKTMFIIMSVFANTAFIGFPLAQDLLGEEGLLYAVIFNMVWILFFFTLGVSMISGQKKVQLKSIFTVPVSVASIVAVLVYVSPFRFPGFVEETLSALGGMVVPISMIVIGCSLVEIHLVEILKDVCSYFVSALRLAIFPLLILLAVWLIPGIPPKVALVCCLSGCLPSASLCVVVSQQYHCEPEYTSRAVVQGMLLMLITIPLFITLAASLLSI